MKMCGPTQFNSITVDLTVEKQTEKLLFLNLLMNFC